MPLSSLSARLSALHPREKLLLLAIGFLFVAVFIYGPGVLRNQFQAFDDDILITENPIVHEISRWSVRQAFTTYDPELYIPLTLTAYQMIYAVAGPSPVAFHAVSVLLHVLNGLLVSILLGLLLKNRAIGVIGGMLFLVHPLHTEAVLWAAGLKDLLCTAFFLGTLISYLRYRATARLFFLVLCVELFFLALLSKVSAASLPLILILIDLLQKRKWDRAAIVEKIPFFLLSGAFLIIGALGKQGVFIGERMVQLFLLAPKSTVFYLSKFIAPFHLSALYEQTQALGFFSLEFLAPALLLLVVASLIVLLRSRILLFGAAFFLLTLAPTFLNAAKGFTLYFASDRYAYIPSIGLFFLLCSGVQVLFAHPGFSSRARGLTLSLLSLIGGVFAMTAHAQSFVWENSVTLFTNALSLYPNSLLALNNRGVAELKAGDVPAALADFEAALRLYPHQPTTHNNLARLYGNQGLMDKALSEYGRSLEIDPLDANVHLGLANLFRRMGREQAARDAISNAYILNPALVEKKLTNRLRETDASIDFLRE